MDVHQRSEWANIGAPHKWVNTWEGSEILKQRFALSLKDTGLDKFKGRASVGGLYNYANNKIYQKHNNAGSDQ